MSNFNKGFLMDIGIIGLGTYLPKNILSSKEISKLTKIPENIIREKFGIYQKYIPGEKDTTSHMGIQAALAAIMDAGIDPLDIDLIIWNGAQHKDYPCWLASLKVADEIGASNAWGFDMEAMCGSMMVGMETARSMMISNPELRTVMLVSGYRNGDLINYKIPETSFMFNLGAGGACMILRKNALKNRILGTSFKGDGSFSDQCLVQYGGTSHWPMKPDEASKLYFTINDIEGFKKNLSEKTLTNFYQVIRNSLKKSGKKENDIDYLALLHFKRSTHLQILKDLNLKDNQTTYLENYGHIGQNDQVLSVKLGLESGKIKEGDTIVMVGAGIGFVWASAVVQWGKI